MAASRAKKSFKRQKVAITRTATIAATVARAVASTTEKKDITQINSTPIVAGTAAASIFLLNGIATGTNATNRVGRRITMTALQLRVNVTLATTSVGSSPLRFLVVYDKQTNGANPMATDVLVNDTIDSNMNLGNSRRFETLCDIEFPCIGTAGPQSAWVNRYVKLNHPVEFNGSSSAAVTAITSGSVIMLAYQNGAIVTTNPLINEVVSRIRFTDS